MHPMQDLFLESFSYELQLDMHSYLHKNFILAKSGCYTGCISIRVTAILSVMSDSIPLQSSRSMFGVLMDMDMVMVMVILSL
jgi:hypothetical protein